MKFVSNTNKSSRLPVIVQCKHSNMLSLNLMKCCLVTKWFESNNTFIVKKIFFDLTYTHTYTHSQNATSVTA